MMAQYPTGNYPVTNDDYSGLLVHAPQSGLEPVPVEAEKEHYRPPAGWFEPSSAAAASPPTWIDQPNEPKQQQILGLSVRTFWTIVILLVVILAGAIGGGVGGGLAAARNSASSSTSNQAPPPVSTGSFSSSSDFQSSSTTTGTTNNNTPTTTTAVPSGPTSPAPTDAGCPSINGTLYTALDATGKALPLVSGGTPQQFQRLCNTNFPAGSGNGNPGVTDLMRVYLPSLEACITACAEYNAQWERNRAEGVGLAATVGDEGLCRAVSVLKAAGSYCYLKSSTGQNNTFGTPRAYSSAMLLMA